MVFSTKKPHCRTQYNSKNHRIVNCSFYVIRKRNKSYEKNWYVSKKG